MLFLALMLPLVSLIHSDIQTHLELTKRLDLLIYFLVAKWLIITTSLTTILLLLYRWIGKDKKEPKKSEQNPTKSSSKDEKIDDLLNRSKLRSKKEIYFEK